MHARLEFRYIMSLYGLRLNWFKFKFFLTVVYFFAYFTTMLFKLFDMYEAEAKRVVKAGMVLPAYDYVLKCSHSFNLLDAAGAISLSERTEYIARVRNLARMCAKGWLKKRKELGFPMLKGSEGK